MNYENAKPLLRITNLKQHFPLKGGLTVKANDGITLDIYEGEVFGLVGESGCGKSTLGRTILQLYRQTDGRTMYYGSNLLDMAPKYAFDTIRKLDKYRRHMHETAQKAARTEKEYQAMPAEKQMHFKNTRDHILKEARDAELNVTMLVGGLIVAENLAPVKEAYLALYTAAAKLRDARRLRARWQLEVDDLEHRKKDVSKPQSKLKVCDQQIQKCEAELESCKKKIAELHKQYAGHADYDRYQQNIDEGVDLARLVYNEIRTLRRDLQLIFQDPYSSLNPRMTVGQTISEGMVTHGLLKKNDSRMQEEVLKVMESCGLAPYFLHRYPHQFSGGQRHRIGIARSLAVQPRFVVCDEAVSALDVSIQSQIINLLYDLREERNLTYLFITHDLSVVKYISDRIGVMYLGNMVELAYSEDIFRRPIHPYTQALISAIPTTDPDQNKELPILEGDIPSPINPPKGCKFHTRCRYCTEECKHAVPDWVEVEPHHFVACHHPLL